MKARIYMNNKQGTGKHDVDQKVEETWRENIVNCTYCWTQIVLKEMPESVCLNANFERQQNAMR